MNWSFKKRKRSLSTKLILLFIVMAFLFMALVGGGLKFAFKSSFQENIRPHLFRYMEYIQKDIGTPPDFERAKEIVKNLPVEIHLYNHDKQWSSTSTPLDLKKIDYYKSFTENEIEYEFGELEGRDYLVSKHSDYTLAFSVPHSPHSWNWRKAIPLAMSLILLVILYHSTRRIFSPIKTIKEGVRKIGEGDFEHRIQIERCDELGDLSDSINQMADDIQQMLEAKRHLLLAISHELRSPMTRVKVSLELLNDEKKREDINRDLVEMDNLIAELLETERLNTRHSVLNKSHVSLGKLIKELEGEFFRNRPFAVDLSTPDIEAHIDIARLKLLLKNLLENAFRHNSKEASPPKLSIHKLDNEIILTVEDFGEGIEEQHIPFLTEPFYRVDPARQRQTGGFGLGLYLCRMIAEAHGGTLKISSENQKGTKVVVTLPADLG